MDFPLLYEFFAITKKWKKNKTKTEALTQKNDAIFFTSSPHPGKKIGEEEEYLEVWHVMQSRQRSW